MNETARQPDGQWCWCDDPPEGQTPHDCAEDHAGRPACQCDGAHVHPRKRDMSGISEWAARARKAQAAVDELGAGPPAARLTESDWQLVARAREIGPALRASSSDRDRLAGWLLAGLADLAERLGAGG